VLADLANADVVSAAGDGLYPGGFVSSRVLTRPGENREQHAAVPLISAANGVLILSHLYRERPTRDLMPIRVVLRPRVDLFRGPAVSHYAASLRRSSGSARRIAGEAHHGRWLPQAEVVPLYAGQSRLRRARGGLEGRQQDDMWSVSLEGLELQFATQPG
jgi:hypothetical protein